MNGRHSANATPAGRTSTMRPTAVGRDAYMSERPATSTVPCPDPDAGIAASTAAAASRLTLRARPVPTR